MHKMQRADPPYQRGHDCQGSQSLSCQVLPKVSLLNDPPLAGARLARFAVGLLLAFAALLASPPAQAQTPLVPANQAELDDLLVGKRMLFAGGERVDFISPGRYIGEDGEGSYIYEKTDPNTGIVTMTADDGSETLCLIFDSRTTGRLFEDCDDLENAESWQLVDIPADAYWTITTFAGRPAFVDGGPAVEAELDNPSGVAVDGTGNLYIADTFNQRIRKVDSTGTITTVAGTGELGFRGDGGPAVEAELDNPSGVAVDGAGNLYIADTDNQRIRKVDSSGVITTIAGTGEFGFGGDEGLATAAQLAFPRGVAVDGTGNLYIADTVNNRIRKLTPMTGPVAPVSTESFSIRDRGAWTATIYGTTETVRVGYGRIRAEAGSTTPSGIAIFQFRDSQDVLISEAGVPAAGTVLAGRIFAEVNGPVNTGLAIANPNDVLATIDFYFTDTTGTRFPSGSFELPAYEQIAKFLNQEPFNETLPDGSPVLGTFTFESSVPIAVTALRGFTNEAGEFLMTTLPVAPLSSASSDTVYFPHFAAGGGWATQVILVNPTDSTITGTVGFLGPGSDTVAASPVVLTLDDGSTGSDFDYSIPPRSSQRFTTSNPLGRVSSGSVRATPIGGTAAPSGLVIFSFASGGKTISEAGVPALPKGSAFRVYVEASGMPGQAGSIRSGLAITNAAATPSTVTLEVTHLDGSLAVPATTLALPPSGQIARFLDEIISLPDNFSGVLRVTSTGDVAMVALRLRVNERGELKMTTTSPSNEMDPSTSEDRFFAHLAESVGWSTQFILFSGTAGQNSSGTLGLTNASGEPWERSPYP